LGFGCGFESVLDEVVVVDVAIREASAVFKKLGAKRDLEKAETKLSAH